MKQLLFRGVLYSCLVFGVAAATLLVLMTIAQYSGSKMFHRVLAHVPYQQHITYSRMADGYSNEAKLERALNYYQKADKVAPKKHKCSVKIKIGDTNFNVAASVSEREIKQRNLQAAVDAYEQCLVIEPQNELAQTHKMSAAEELSKLQSEQSQAGQHHEIEPQPQGESSGLQVESEDQSSNGTSVAPQVNR